MNPHFFTAPFPLFGLHLILPAIDGKDISWTDLLAFFMDRLTIQLHLMPGKVSAGLSAGTDRIDLFQKLVKLDVVSVDGYDLHQCLPLIGVTTYW